MYDKTFNSTPRFYTLYAAFKLTRGFPFRSAGRANANIPVQSSHCKSINGCSNVCFTNIVNEYPLRDRAALAM